MAAMLRDEEELRRKNGFITVTPPAAKGTTPPQASLAVALVVLPRFFQSPCEITRGSVSRPRLPDQTCA
jgi:hypothetical protein